MKLKNKMLISAAALIGCAGIATGATYALFTSSKTVNNHINAGSLKVGFYLQSLAVDALDSDGFIVTNNVDLTTWEGFETGKGVNLATFADDVIAVEKFCPTMEGVATFAIYNEGDIAFDYSVVVLEESKTATWADQTDKSDNFDDVMKLTIDEETHTLKKGASATTELSFVFDKDAGNEWMEASFEFDVQLTATQAVKPVSSSAE